MATTLVRSYSKVMQLINILTEKLHSDKWRTHKFRDRPSLIS